MVEVDTDCRREQGVTLVRATITNTRSTAQTVRIESQLSGPTWPPQRDGNVRPEWTGETWEATIDPGQTCGIGFASPAPPTTPPIEVVTVSRADEDDQRQHRLHSLDGWAPPSDVFSGEQ